MPTPIEQIWRIAEEHGIAGPCELLASSGMVNEAWLLDGRFVLRITVERDALDEAARDAYVVPLARAAGIRTPELLVADTRCSLVDTPYTIYRRAEGELLGHMDREPCAFGPAYRELGRELALLHAIDIPEADRGRLHGTFQYDGHKQIAKTFDAGKITRDETTEIEAWSDRLLEATGDGDRRTFLHQDIHPWNVFVDPKSKSLTSIIDWGDAAWGDPAGEFASMPLIAMPEMYAGYEENGGTIDDGMKARSLLFGLGLSLWELRELDPVRFSRQWWRLSPGRFTEAFEVFERVLAGAD